MKKLILVGLMGLLANNLLAYKVYKERDHWGIFAGFSAIEEKTFGHIGADGSFVIRVTEHWLCDANGDGEITFTIEEIS